MKQTAAPGGRYRRAVLPLRAASSEFGIKEPLFGQHSGKQIPGGVCLHRPADSENSRKASSRVHFTFHLFQLSLHTDEHLQAGTHLILIKAASRERLVGPMRSSCSSESDESANM